MSRQLLDLVSVGPTVVEDLEMLGITRVDQLVGKDPFKLYQMLCERSGKRHCICVCDVFAAAVAQAENPDLPADQCTWFYYSRLRDCFQIKPKERF